MKRYGMHLRSVLAGLMVICISQLSVGGTVVEGYQSLNIRISNDTNYHFSPKVLDAAPAGFFDDMNAALTYDQMGEDVKAIESYDMIVKKYANSTVAFEGATWEPSADALILLLMMYAATENHTMFEQTEKKLLNMPNGYFFIHKGPMMGMFGEILPETLILKGDYYVRHKMFDEAAAVYNRVISNYPRSGKGYLNSEIAEHYLNIATNKISSDFPSEKAIDTFHQLLNEKHWPVIHSWIARIYENKKDYASSVREYRTYLEMSPEDNYYFSTDGLERYGEIVEAGVAVEKICSYVDPQTALGVIRHLLAHSPYLTQKLFLNYMMGKLYEERFKDDLKAVESYENAIIIPSPFVDVEAHSSMTIGCYQAFSYFRMAKEKAEKLRAYINKSK